MCRKWREPPHRRPDDLDRHRRRPPELATGHRSPRPFDTLGPVLGSGGLTIAVLGHSEGSSWGGTSTSTLVGILGGAAMVARFVVQELRTDHPLIE